LSIKAVMKRSMMLLAMMIAMIITMLTYVNEIQALEPNLARNEDRLGYPIISTSYTYTLDSPWNTIDGIFSLNRWTTWEGGNYTDWLALDFGSAKTFNQVKLYLYNDGGGVQPPSSYNVQYYTGIDVPAEEDWVNVTNQVKSPKTPAGAINSTALEADTLNTVVFDTVVANRLRVVFTRGNNTVGLVELEVFDNSIPPGDGTVESPYEISTATHLQYMSSDLSAYYVLTNDIDLTNVPWTPIAPDMGNPFYGNFNGQGYTISNLSINTASSDGIGLFGAVGPSGWIENLTIDGAVISGTGRNFVGTLAGSSSGYITNVNISNTNVEGSSSVGGLVGMLGNGGFIANAHVAGTVNGQYYVGGLVGEQWGISITDSSTAVTVTAVLDDAGGLSGSMFNSSITNSYSTGNVMGVNRVGGLVGNADASHQD
jgi:hypothetical protein